MSRYVWSITLCYVTDHYSQVHLNSSFSTLKHATSDQIQKTLSLYDVFYSVTDRQVNVV